MTLLYFHNGVLYIIFLPMYSSSGFIFIKIRRGIFTKGFLFHLSDSSLKLHIFLPTVFFLPIFVLAYYFYIRGFIPNLIYSEINLTDV